MSKLRNIVIGPPIFRAVLEMDSLNNVRISFNKQIPITQWISILATVIKGNADQMTAEAFKIVGAKPPTIGHGEHIGDEPPNLPEKVATDATDNGNGQA